MKGVDTRMVRAKVCFPLLSVRLVDDDMLRLDFHRDEMYLSHFQYFPLYFIKFGPRHRTVFDLVVRRHLNTLFLIGRGMVIDSRVLPKPRKPRLMRSLLLPPKLAFSWSAIDLDLSHALPTWPLFFDQFCSLSYGAPEQSLKGGSLTMVGCRFLPQKHRHETNPGWLLHATHQNLPDISWCMVNCY